MSARAKELAARLEQINQDVIDVVSGATNLSVPCPSEGWTAAAVAAHIGSAHRGILEGLIQPIVAGQEVPSTVGPSDEGNARQAAENAALPRDQVLTLLRDHGAMATAYLRSLSDDDLDRTVILPIFGESPVTAELVIERILIGHAADHANSLRQGLEQTAGHTHDTQVALV
jgi:Mycothiol maleylpyruvate isomerase N-terminal domain